MEGEGFLWVIRRYSTERFKAFFCFDSFHCRHTKEFIIYKILTRYMRKRLVLFLLEELVAEVVIVFFVVSFMLSINNSRRVRRRVAYAQPYGMLSRIPDQVLHMSRMFLDSDVDCISNLRMDRNSFGRLCFLMRELGGLVDRRMSGQTVSHYVHIVLRAVLSLHTLFLVKPTPVTDDSTDSRWKWFKVELSLQLNLSHSYKLSEA
ncbi:hypothetical protein ACS0TY_008844 [Phlomoides rotata]